MITDWINGALVLLWSRFSGCHATLLLPRGTVAWHSKDDCEVDKLYVWVLIISEFNLGSVQDPTGPSTHHKQLFFHSLPSVSFLRKGIVLSLSPPPASSGGRGSDGAEGDDNLKTFSAKFVSWRPSSLHLWEKPWWQRRFEWDITMSNRSKKLVMELLALETVHCQWSGRSSERELRKSQVRFLMGHLF